MKDKPATIKSQCQHTENDIRAAVILIINSGAKLLAEYKRPTVEIVIATTNLILSQYSHLCIEDVRLCIQNLCSGLYGEIIALDFERYGKAFKTYSEEKRQTEVSYQPSNQFPKNEYTPCKMPEDVRQILKQKIGYKYKKDEKLVEVKRDWKKEHPSLTDEEVSIFQYFDDLWKKQSCMLKKGTKDVQVIDWNGTIMTRGEFTKEAKALINQSTTNKNLKQKK